MARNKERRMMKGKGHLPSAMHHSSIALTGFMGTGKSSVGKIVAARLEREFVDMDALIETRAGKSVREIFEKHGEAYFRWRESELCSELGKREKLVIATGGGSLISEANHKQFANAFVICLDASVDEIVARLNTAQDRPLLAGGDARERVESLLNARREAYARIEWHVETTGRSAEQVADGILELYQKAIA